MIECVERIGSDGVIYLASRISRSAKPFAGLVEELKDVERVSSLLGELYRAGHLSVFEHSLVRMRVDMPISELRHHLFDFKYAEATGEDQTTVSFNPRTALEMLRSKDELIRTLSVRALQEFPLLASVVRLKSDEEGILAVEPTRVLASGHITVHSVLESDHDDPKHGFYSFLIDGLSRVASHQLVRHRTLSFTQQSQRHVTAADHHFPDHLSDEAKELMRKGVAKSFALYGNLLTMNIAMEDARYALPQAVTTRMFVSGRKKAWLHFLMLRLKTDAQEEIRRLARLLAPVLGVDVDIQASGAGEESTTAN